MQTTHISQSRESDTNERLFERSIGNIFNMKILYNDDSFVDLFLHLVLANVDVLRVANPSVAPNNSTSVVLK